MPRQQSTTYRPSGVFGWWFVARSPAALPYPCRCWESPRSCGTNWCPCWRRNDLVGLPPQCCGWRSARYLLPSS